MPLTVTRTVTKSDRAMRAAGSRIRVPVHQARALATASASGPGAARKWTLSEASAKLRNGETSSVQLTRECLAQMAESKQLNAFVSTSPEVALRHAEEADKRRAAGQSKGALDGIPLAVKDNFCTSELGTTAGSNILKGFQPPHDSTVWARLRAGGAVLLGKTSMDEFGMGSANNNTPFGAALNPWSEEKGTGSLSPGGSSGGSASAVASGCAFGAIGSDTGGSVRLPASYCGVVGLKPTYGRVSRFGLIAYASSLDCPGVITRTVEDAGIMLRAIEGVDSNDATSAARPATGVSPAGARRKLRVGIPKEYHMSELPSEISELWYAVADKWRAAGAEVVSVSLPSTALALPAYYILAPAEAASNLARYDGVRFGTSGPLSSPSEAPSLSQGQGQGQGKSTPTLSEHYTASRSSAEGFGPEVRRRILVGNFVLSSAAYQGFVAKAQQLRRRVRADFDAAFAGIGSGPGAGSGSAGSGVDVILTPTCTSAAPSFAQLDADRKSNPVSEYLNDVMTIPSSLAGLPAISVPAGLSAKGLPLGLQLIAPQWHEEALLSAAAELEKMCGRFPAKA